MATEIAAAYVSLVPSARGIGSKISRELSGIDGIAKQVGSQASNSLHSKLTAGFSRTVSELGRLARQGGLLIAGGLGVALGFGVKVAADFEQTRIAFEGILGDVGKATALLADLRNFANRTPFEFAGLADSAKNLLAVGFKAEDIIPTMTTLGNVAATLGVGEAEIAGVVRALGQMKGKGKASAEELNQISEQVPGFSAIKALADGMGISVAQVSDMMMSPGGLINAGVDGSKAIELILEGMEKFPGAAGAMERQSHTLNGVLSTFKDTLATTAIDFITPYLPALSTGVQSFSGWITNTAVPALHTFVDWIGDLVDRWGPGLVDLFTNHLIPTVKGLVDDGLEAIKGWWDRNGENITTFFTDFGKAAGDVFGKIGDWIWDSALPALKDFGKWFVSQRPLVIGALAAIAAGFLAWAINAGIAAAATLLATWEIVAVIIIIGALVAALVYAYEKWGWFHDGVWKSIYALGEIKKVIKTVIGWVDTLIDDLKIAFGWVDDLLDKIPGGGKGTGLLGTVLGGVFNPVGTIGGLLAGADGGVVPGRKGIPMPILAHGGETVLPTHRASLAQLARGATGGPMIGELHVVQMPGEDPVQTAFRETRRQSLLAAVG